MASRNAASRVARVANKARERAEAKPKRPRKKDVMTEVRKTYDRMSATRDVRPVFVEAGAVHDAWTRGVAAMLMVGAGMIAAGLILFGLYLARVVP